MASLPNFNALLMDGFNTGREMKRQEGERNALAGLVSGDENALGSLATYNPQLAFQVRERQQQQSAQQDQQRQKMLAEGKKAVGQAALQIAQLPEGQRAAAWDQQIDYLVGQGWDGLAQFKGKYSPQSLMGVISEAGLANELRQATQPNWIVIPEGAVMANTRDTAAVSQFGAPQQPGRSAPATPPSPPALSANEAAGMLRSAQSPQQFLQWQERFGNPVLVNSPEEAAAFPSGTLLQSADGRIVRKQ